MLLTVENSDKKTFGIKDFICLSFDTAKGGGPGLNIVFKHIHIHTYKTGIYKKKKSYTKRQGICM